jgi:ribonuclease HII
MHTIAGIDEAGRGCVLGPLVVAGVAFSKRNLARLEHLGVADSKQLTRAQREMLAPLIEALAEQIHLVTVPPSALGENLTQVELRAMAQIINQLRTRRVVLDLPVGPRAKTHFCQSLLRVLAHAPDELIAENGADARFLVVGAASILAKVHRDALVQALHRKYGDFGWGYPGEPKTRTFLKDWYARHGAFPDCVRLKWKTVRALLQEQAALEW